MTKRWKQKPPGSNWGEFGDDDQRGRMNYVTREKVLQGIAEVKEGRTFCLSLPLDTPGGNVLNPRRNPPRIAATLRDGGPRKGGQNFCYPFELDMPGATDVVCDDVVLMTLQYSTQWDSFAHVGSRFDADGDGKREAVFYNGFRAGEDVVPAPEKPGGTWDKYEGSQAKALGIEKLAEHGVQGRGVLIDLHHHFQRKRHPVRADELLEILKKDDVQVQKGDMVCLYTGFGDVIMEQKKNPDPKVMHAVCSGLDGRDPKLLEWVSDSGLACLIGDNYAVELIPTGMDFSTPHAAMPLHEHCLFKNGIHLGEMFWLSELARWLREHKRNRFLLTAPPLRLPGAVGSPSTAIATV